MVFSMFPTAKWRSLILVTTLLLLPCPMMAGELAVSQPAPGSDFRTLAARVALADRLARYDFATITLSQLITDYETSYRESALEQHSKPKAQRKLARWRRESRFFIDQLKARLAGINQQSHIEISVDQTGSLVLFIDNTPIVISGPEIGKVGQMEQQVVERFCTLHDCARYRDTEPQPGKRPAARRVRGNWLLQSHQGAIYTTGDGLSFVFSSLDGRVEKQARCEAVAQDLRLLVAGLADAQRAGYTIDWEQLRLATLHDGITRQAVINNSGDYLNLKLTILGGQLNLDEPLLEWVKRQVTGEPAKAIIADAERLLR